MAYLILACGAYSSSRLRKKDPKAGESACPTRQYKAYKQWQPDEGIEVGQAVSPANLFLTVVEYSGTKRCNEGVSAELPTRAAIMM